MEGRDDGGAPGLTGRLRAGEGTPRVWVSRAALVNRLRAARTERVATLVAPVGYGKSTLLAQWAARDDRPFAFVALDRPDIGAARLVGRVVEALCSLGASDLDVPKQAGPPARWIWRVAVPRLASAMRSIEPPFVLVFDDANRLDVDAADVVTALISHVPDGSMVVLAGRAQPLPSLPRFRASGELIELGVDDLALTRREARSLLRSLGVAVSDAQLDEVFERTEGWAAGIRLAGLARLARRTPPHVLTAADENVSEYVRAEYLAVLTPDERAFVRRTSILDRLSPSLCDAVLERDDSLLVLSSLEGSHALLIALDRDRQWFRYHHAVREELRRELEEQESSLGPELERRAAAWLEANDEREQALGHAYAAGDYDHAARLLEAVAPALHNAGRDGALLGWIALIDEAAEMADYPALAVLAARLHAQRGADSEAERCLAAAIRGPFGRKPGRVAQPLAARIDLVYAAMCGDGPEAMLAASESALEAIPADDCWRSYGLLLQGCALALLDDNVRADLILSRAVHAAKRLGSRETGAIALTQRALLASAGGERIRAGQLLDLAREEIAQGHLEEYPTSALALAASARLELLHGHSPEAFVDLASARALLPGLGRSLPWLAVQARLELVGADVTLCDIASARALLAEVDELLVDRPRLGSLRRRRDLLAAAIVSMPAHAGGRSVGLTAAELRLVPMLATHLSFREIGARFYLSRNTVKTQAISVYRKLGASSRSEAVARAYGLGLIAADADAELLIQIG